MVQYKYDFDEDATPVNVPPHVTNRDQMYDAVKRMFEMPQFKDTKFQFRWNHVILTMDKDTTREDIDAQYREQDAAYREAPEYKAQELQANDRQKDAQTKADALAAKLPEAIKKGEAAVINWLDEMSGYLDKHGVDIDQEAAANQLRRSGICPIEMHKGDDTGNASAVAQNLITNAVLSMEEHGGLFPNMVQPEAARYREIKKDGKDRLGMARKMANAMRPPGP